MGHNGSGYFMTEQPAREWEMICKTVIGGQ
jgi:hypothetical protein